MVHFRSTPVPAAFVPAAFVPAPAYPAPVFDFVPARPEAGRTVVDAERPGDARARESLLDRAFGPARFAKTCERLRAGRLPADGLSLVARDHSNLGGGADGGAPLVGTVRLWHVCAGGVPALMLGPLAVEAEWRCHKVGARLMDAAITRATALGHRAIVLVGDAPYYARFGFSQAPVRRLAMPGPVEHERFLGLELVPGGLDGARGLVVARGAVDLATRCAARRRPMRRAA